jgi:hypothetical protein
MTSTCAARLMSALCLAMLFAAGVAQAQLSDNVEVFATGLHYPRGLKFGPDGDLYVAEAGTGGQNSACIVVPIVGPYTGGPTARISKISRHGRRTTVVDGLPSAMTALPTRDTHGVADVAFIGHTLYALIAGGGCSHANPDVPSAIIQVHPDGTWTVVADLIAFLEANPVANPSPVDFEPEGTWYSMVAVRGKLYAVESNHGELDEITPDGTVRRVIDISASQGHVVPTAVAFHGNFYVGDLTTFFPVQQGAANIYTITPSGRIKIAVRDLTAVLGVAFDHEGRLYALETTEGGELLPVSGTGRIVRVTQAGELEEIASGLTFPTAMTFGPDGRLYVSNFGYGFDPDAGIGPDAGQIVRITVPPASDGEPR